MRMCQSKVSGEVKLNHVTVYDMNILHRIYYKSHSGWRMYQLCKLNQVDNMTISRYRKVYRL